MSTLSQTELIVDYTQDAMFLVAVEDDGYRIERINSAYEEITGIGADDICGRTPTEVFGRAAGGRVERFYDDCADGREPIEYDERLPIDGETTYWHTKLTPVVDEGEVTRIVGATREVTDRRRSEAEQQALLQVLSRMYQITTDGSRTLEDKVAAVLDLGTGYLGVPYGFLNEIDRGDDGEGEQRIVAATGDHDLIDEGDSCPLSEAYCRKTIDTEDLLVVEDALAAGWENDPAYRAFELGCYIGGRVMVDGELYGSLCFVANDARGSAFTDAERSFVRLATRWMSYEIGRERSKREIERQRDRFEEFSELVAHDLRNPLAAAKGQLGLARGGDDVTARLDRVAEQLDRMDDLLTDTLTLAREGRRIDDPEPVDLAPRVTAAARSASIDADGVEVATDQRIAADPARLDRLIENLLRNAAEHGGDGVTVTVEGTRDGFAVADDGPGIPPEDRDAVLETGFSTRKDGTGFGLAIVAAIAEAHGWTVTVEESDDGGARFVFGGVALAPDED